MDDLQRDMAYDNTESAKPVVVPAWRGRFSIPKRDLDINVAAHISNKACIKVWNIARVMSETLHLEMIPRINVWPPSFMTSPPTEHSIGLFFFSEGRDEGVLDWVLNDAIYKDLAFKAMIGKSELLIFTSLQLPEKLHSECTNRGNCNNFGGNFICGVSSGDKKLLPLINQIFRITYKTVDRDRVYLHIQTIVGTLRRRGARLTFLAEIVIISYREVVFNIVNRLFQGSIFLVIYAAKPDKRGRHLDDASREEILRLKVHLDGGDSKMHVGPFPKLSPTVKEVNPDCVKRSTVSMSPAARGSMYEWVKNSTASKMKRKSLEGDVETDNRGRTLDNAWEHVKPLDTARQKTQCKFCGFISTYGGISRLKAHLSGGCPKQVQGCPKVSPQVKSAMEQWFNDWAQNSKAIWIKNSPCGKPTEIEASTETSKRGRQLDDTWEHVIPLDEMRESLNCKYCNFVSKHGGIACLEAHLGGGDPTLEIQGCPNALPKVESLMAEEINKCSNKSKGATMETAREALQEADSRGRRLDDAWEHAKPIDETRQKTQCNYCGFISTYGGISRLKAHLGGGHPQLQLQGCTKVSPQVKSVMEVWFNEWAQNSKACWLKKYPRGKLHKTAKNSKRGRPLDDDSWEHAIPLDEMRQSAKRKYCDFASKNEFSEKSKGATVDTAHEVVLQGAESTKTNVQWFGKRHHILQETLDEITNTSVKDNLRKWIDEKNCVLQMMHFEIKDLETRLSSMP